MRMSTCLKGLTLTLLLLGGAAHVSVGAESCTPSGTEVEQGSWKKVRHLIGDGKAKCFESKCDVTWQLYKESSCSKKILKKDCQERNVQIVDEKVSC